jgi:hypothetical protein
MSSSAAALLDRLGRPHGVRLAGSYGADIPRLSTGLPALDGAVEGGLPRGRVTELAGPSGAGRTGIAFAIAAHATRAGETIAWVDAEDALDPDAAVDTGVVLARTLWVRPRHPDDALRAAELLLRAGGFGLVTLDLGVLPARSGAAPAVTRLARAAEASRTALLVLTPEPTVGAAAALGLAVRARRIQWSGGPGRMVALDGIEAVVHVTRNRLGRSGAAIVAQRASA